MERGPITGHRAKAGKGRGVAKGRCVYMCVWAGSHCFSKADRWREKNERGWTGWPSD